ARGVGLPSLMVVWWLRRPSHAAAGDRCRAPVAGSDAHSVEDIMKDSERRLLTELRRALLPLHKTLLEWERKTYEREHGRKMGGGELLQVIMTAPQFAWLHPISELIVRIDQTRDEEAPDTPVDVDVITTPARRLAWP